MWICQFAVIVITSSVYFFAVTFVTYKMAKKRIKICAANV